jgi:outer membrane protein OmpA-like peptidoglycan-associated protein
MNLHPFHPFQAPGASKPKSRDEIFFRSKPWSGRRRAAPAAKPEAMDMPPPERAPEPGKKRPAAVLRNPKWSADKVGFNEEAEVSVDVELPAEHAHKTKVIFELYAATPKGPERISQGEGAAKDGRAIGKVPVYIPAYRDENGNPLQKAEYYFLAKHSEAETLDGSRTPKVVAEMADRLIESHILPDLAFATGSSFLRPDQAPGLKDMCARIRERRKMAPDGKLVVFGHVDAIGQEAACKALSERRAKSVLAFLLKDPDGMETLYGQEKWGLAASQELLKSLGHDPGATDGQDGGETQAAAKAFQAAHGLARTGSVDSHTRKALFKAFMDDCNTLALTKKDFDDINGNASAGCSGFNLAEKTAGANGSNRRVGVFLLKSNKNFPIAYPCAQGGIGPCQKQAGRKGARRTGGFGCSFYDKLILERPNEKPAPEPAPRSAPSPASKGSLKRFLHASEKELRQYVNVSGGKREGMEFHLEVEIEGAVDKVYWKAIAGKGNSKRNDPAPGWMDSASNKPIALSGGMGEWESAVIDGKAKAVFCLGLAGGDEFVFEAGVEKGKKELEQKVINWRRLWYQLTHHKDITPPSMATAVKKLESVFIEFAKDSTVTHAKAPAGKVYVGSHNASEYHGMLATKHTGQCVNIILCDQQYDGIDAYGDNYMSENRVTLTGSVDRIQLSSPADNLEILNPPLQKGAKLLLSSKWKNTVTGKSGTLTDDASKLDDDTGLARWLDKDFFEVTLPKNATPSGKTPVNVSLKATAAFGPWGGDGGTAPHNLVVIDKDDTIHSQCVLHELGHIINMVPFAGHYKAPPGFALGDHTHSYIKMGGAGSHCSWEIDATASSPRENVNGKCIMFHRLNYECKLVYCPECEPLVKAQSILKFQELKG